MNTQELKHANDLPLLSFNDVKECCHDDSAGAGCLYLNEEKLKEKIAQKIAPLTEKDFLSIVNKHLYDSRIKI